VSIAVLAFALFVHVFLLDLVRGIIELRGDGSEAITIEAIIGGD